MYSDLSESKVTCIRRLYGVVDESLWEGVAPGRPFGIEGRGRPLEFRLLHVVEYTDSGQMQSEQVSGGSGSHHPATPQGMSHATNWRYGTK